MKIVLTGGGTAGHVMPHIALLPYLKQNFEIYYIGSAGIEKEIISKYPEITFHEISSGKLIRSLSPKNLFMPFKVIKAYFQSRKLLKRIKPDIIFSKGGYVALPVVIAHGKIPVVTHESDITMGLANRLMKKCCAKILTTFEDTAKNIPNAVCTGAPVRDRLLRGHKSAALKLTGFTGSRPIALFIGGSLGAVAINKTLRTSLPEINKKYDVIHITGKGNKLDSLESSHYRQIEFTENIEDIFAAADVVVSRAGSNAIMEFMTLKKPLLMIPLPKGNSRGDQIDNANYLVKRGLAHVLFQENLTSKSLMAAMEKLYSQRLTLIAKMSAQAAGGTAKIFTEIMNIVSKNK